MVKNSLGGSDPGSLAFLLGGPGPHFSSWFLCLQTGVDIRSQSWIRRLCKYKSIYNIKVSYLLTCQERTKSHPGGLVSSFLNPYFFFTGSVLF